MRKHVMVRIGGGWDTFEHYITKHDPCRTTIGGMYFFFPYIFYSFSWMKKHIPDSMERLYLRNISMYRMFKKFCIYAIILEFVSIDYDACFLYN